MMHLRDVVSIGASLAALFATGSCAQQASVAPRPGDQPQELGLVAWQRDFEAATAAAQRVDKPMLLLFQEVPG